jgi:hypothetical protein
MSRGGHAIGEQVFADLIDGPLAHLPSGRFAANPAWQTLAAMTHNLHRPRGIGNTGHATGPDRHTGLSGSRAFDMATGLGHVGHGRGPLRARRGSVPPRDIG